MSETSSDWLYEHLAPFLKRMPREAAFMALDESIRLGHLSAKQLKGLLEVWARKDMVASVGRDRREYMEEMKRGGKDL